MTNLADIDPSEYVPTLTLLKTIDFLQGVPEESLKSMLFSLQKQSFPANKTILFQGEISNNMFIIRKGSVKITAKNKGEKLVLAELKPPAYFGEISLLTPTSATATVAAGDEGTEVLILNHDSMQLLTRKMPDIGQRIQKVIDQRIASKKAAGQVEETE